MYHIIANTKSGQNRKSVKAAASLQKFLEKNNIEHKFYFTERAGHAAALAGELSASPGANIVAMGGDGTFHEVLNGLQNLDSTVLGLIPGGSGNDFARSVSLKRKKPVGSFKRILKNNIINIDYLQFYGPDGAETKRCLNIAGTGLDIEVLLKARAIRRLTGKPKYLLALIRALKRFDPYRMTVSVNGQSETFDCIMMGVCNGTDFGGGIKLSPMSKVDDGVLDIVIIKMVERKKIKWLLPRFIRGKHIGKYYCVHYRSDACKITNDKNYKINLDGEIYSNLNFDCKLIAGGLKIYG